MRRPGTQFLVRWRCPITGQKQRILGDFNRVETICRRLKRHDVAHRWGVVPAPQPAHTTWRYR
jgi:hypothetical protein